MLAAAIERELDHVEHSAPRFRFGSRDCLLWPANIVRRAIGLDPAEPWRGRYAGKRSAAAVIGPKGLLWAARLRARELGARRVRVADAEIGDWGVLKTQAGRGSVIKYRGDWWLGCADRGFTLIPSNRIAAAWSFCE
jgi:hypothetical protein